MDFYALFWEHYWRHFGHTFGSFGLDVDTCKGRELRAAAKASPDGQTYLACDGSQKTLPDIFLNVFMCLYFFFMCLYNLMDT